MFRHYRVILRQPALSHMFTNINIFVQVYPPNIIKYKHSYNKLATKTHTSDDIDIKWQNQIKGDVT